MLKLLDPCPACGQALKECTCAPSVDRPGPGLQINRRQKDEAMYQFKERTYLTADGKPTKDEAEANELLGHPGDEIPLARARALGLTRTQDPVDSYELTERVFVDADGKVVPEGHDSAVTLLGAPGTTIPLEQAKALGLVEDGGQAKPTKKELLKRAEELGIEGLTERTKNDDIEAAIKAAEDAS